MLVIIVMGHEGLYFKVLFPKWPPWRQGLVKSFCCLRTKISFSVKCLKNFKVCTSCLLVQRVLDSKASSSQQSSSDLGNSLDCFHIVSIHNRCSNVLVCVCMQMLNAKVCKSPIWTTTISFCIFDDRRRNKFGTFLIIDFKVKET